MTSKIAIDFLPTGVPGLDTLVNGGICQYSFNVITGAPGSGKTTLAHQLMFSLTGTARKALYFTIIGEPPLKMLRYQQQYAYFEPGKVGKTIKYLNLADDLHSGSFEGVLDRILREVEQFQPDLVFVDSFKSVVHAAKEGQEGLADLQYFVQRLGMHMSSWQATTFLIGEYPNAEEEENPIFTVADGVIHLAQEADQNAVVRKIRVVKMRGQAHMLGLHSFRIDQQGLRIFPRLLTGGIVEHDSSAKVLVSSGRISTGCTGLDAMMCGGIPSGYSVLLVGPPGCGKTITATAFLAQGAKVGERGVLASFEHIVSASPNRLLNKLMHDGHVGIIRPTSLDLSIEEIVIDIIEKVDELQAKRVVIDSLSALELALAPQFKQNFEQSLFRMLAAFSKKGVTVLMIRNTEGAPVEHAYRASGSFLVDAVISMRFAEEHGKLLKFIAVDKLRGSEHSADIRPYTVQDNGITVE